MVVGWDLIQLTRDLWWLSCWQDTHKEISFLLDQGNYSPNWMKKTMRRRLVEENERFEITWDKLDYTEVVLELILEFCHQTNQNQTQEQGMEVRVDLCLSLSVVFAISIFVSFFLNNNTSPTPQAQKMAKNTSLLNLKNNWRKNNWRTTNKEENDKNEWIDSYVTANNFHKPNSESNLRFISSFTSFLFFDLISTQFNLTHFLWIFTTTRPFSSTLPEFTWISTVFFVDPIFQVADPTGEIDTFIPLG